MVMLVKRCVLLMISQAVVVAFCFVWCTHLVVAVTLDGEAWTVEVVRNYLFTFTLVSMYFSVILS